LINASSNGQNKHLDESESKLSNINNNKINHNNKTANFNMNQDSDRNSNVNHNNEIKNLQDKIDFIINK